MKYGNVIFGSLFLGEVVVVIFVIEIFSSESWWLEFGYVVVLVLIDIDGDLKF